MSDIGLVVYGIMAFIMSVLGGASGGGGGFILTPLLIFLGLTPAQAVANGKFGALSVSVGSLIGLRGHKVSSKKLVFLLVVMAIISGIISPKIIVSFDSDSYEKFLGLLLMALAPLIVYKKFGHTAKAVNKKFRLLGIMAVGISMFIVGVFGGGVGILINIAMMGLLGMTAIDASVTKRLSLLIQNSIIIIGLLSSGLFILKVIIVGVITHLLGGVIGGKLAIKKGSEFVSKLIAVAAFASGLYLVVN